MRANGSPEMLFLRGTRGTGCLGDESSIIAEELMSAFESPSNEPLMRAVEIVGLAVREDCPTDLGSVLERLGGDEALLFAVIEFLSHRDPVLTAADDRRLFHQETIARRVLKLLSSETPIGTTKLADELALPSAVVCQVLGWLDRDGRIKIDIDADSLKVRLA